MQSSKYFNWPVLIVHMVLGSAVVTAIAIVIASILGFVDLINPSPLTRAPFGGALFVSALATVAMVPSAIFTGIWFGFRSTNATIYSRSEALIVGSICSAAVLISVSRSPIDELHFFLILLGGVVAWCCRWLLLWGEYLEDQ